MTKLNVHEAKTHLSRYLVRIEQGETIVLCRRDKPIAEIRPLRAERREPRPIGGCEGQFSIPPEFFDPLPDEILSYFTTTP